MSTRNGLSSLTDQRQNCWQTRREWHFSSDKTVCKRSADTLPRQRLEKLRCHRSSTTAHRWNFYSKLGTQTAIKKKELKWTNLKNTHRPSKGCHAHRCSGLRACCHDGCTQHTGRIGSHLGFFPGHKTVSMETSGRANSSCSGFFWPHVAPCPSPSAGIGSCSASLPSDPPPVAETEDDHDLLCACLSAEKKKMRFIIHIFFILDRQKRNKCQTKPKNKRMS